MCTIKVVRKITTPTGEVHEEEKKVPGIDLTNKPKGLRKAVQKAKKLFSPLPDREHRRKIKYVASVDTFFDK